MPEGITGAKVDPASGLKARSGCPQALEERFLAGTEPTESCPLHAGGLGGWFRKLFHRAAPAPERLKARQP